MSSEDDKVIADLMLSYADQNTRTVSELPGWVMVNETVARTMGMSDEDIAKCPRSPGGLLIVGRGWYGVEHDE